MVALLKLHRPSWDCLQLENKKEEQTKSLNRDSFSPSEQVFNLVSLTSSLSSSAEFLLKVNEDEIPPRVIYFFPFVAEAFGVVMG